LFLPPQGQLLPALIEVGLGKITFDDTLVDKDTNLELETTFLDFNKAAGENKNIRRPSWEQRRVDSTIERGCRSPW
jgi:hypothetical protein